MTEALPTGRPAVAIAAIAAAAIGGFLVVRDVIGIISAMVSSVVFSPGGDLFTDFGWYFEGRFGLVLPMAIGVFLVFWLLAPASWHRRVRSVLLRSSVAVAGGIVLYLIGGTIVRWLTSPLAFAGAGVEIVATREQFLTIQHLPVFMLLEAAQLLITVMPVVLLIGVLLWHWQRRAPVVADGAAASRIVD
jgi:hypothetical protein